MSEGSLAVVRACLDAWQRGAFDEALSLYSEDAVWRQTYGVEVRTYRGREGVARSMEEWVGAFVDYWLEFEELIDVGDKVVLVWREGGKGRTSGVEVEDTGATVFTVEDGLITRAEFYPSRAEALEAATSDAGPGPRP